MAKKTKKDKIQEENNYRLFWLIMSLIMAVLTFFTLSKMGGFGVISNNIFTYLFGSAYIVIILSVFAYGIYYIFFKEKQKSSTKFIIGIILLNIFVILLNAYILNDVSTFSELSDFISKYFLPQFERPELPKMSGVLGSLLYVTLNVLVSRQGVLILLIVLILIALILLIPLETYKSAYHETKQAVNNTADQIKRLREEERQAALKREEERKALQAEQMAKEAELEELRRQEELNKQEEIEEVEEIIEEEVVEKKPKVRPEDVLSNSPTFINLNEKEIYGSGRKKEEVKQETITEDILLESKPKVLQAKKKHTSYKLPKPYEDYLDHASSSSSSVNKTSASVKGEKVIEILSNFGIEAQLLNTYIGPSVTKFEIKPASSVKINKIMNISDNIKMELAAKDIRIEAPIPGRSAVGIEIPNVEPVPVRMLDLIKSVPSDLRKKQLLFALGKDLMGKPVFCDLAKMPHLLIAGATGSGKSVCINTIITSFLLRTNPDDVKLVLVDPKKVEFTPYKDIPHLLWPVIDDAQMASNMLKKIVVIMEDRYDLFAASGVRNIESYNNYVDEYNQNLSGDEQRMEKLPYMVIIIDELADLMAIAGKDVELSIQRITQLARASGIHLIVATQRPSTDVITGLIKSNIPSRISFAVASSIDSRTILDQTGAERLLGNGDMLYFPQGESAPIRLQGVYVTDKEINNLTKYVKSQAAPEYEDSYFEFLTNMNGSTVMSASSVNADSQDSLYDDVVEFVKVQQKASTSLLQRRFGIGYNRAARLIDTLEDRGIIGPANGAKPREVYLKPDEIEE